MAQAAPSERPLARVAARNCRAHPGRVFALAITVAASAAFLVAISSIEAALVRSSVPPRFPHLLTGSAAVTVFLLTAAVFQLAVRAEATTGARLRVFGATSGRVFRAAATCSLLIGVPSAGLGALAGLAVGSRDTNWVVAAVSAAVPLAGALVAVWASSLAARRVSVAQALRSSEGPNLSSLLPGVLGGVFLIGAGAVALYLCNGEAPRNAGPVLSGAAIVLLLGVVGLAPGVIWVGTWVLPWPFLPLARVPASLAARDLRRQARRAATAAAPLFLGGVLIAGWGTLIANTDPEALLVDPTVTPERLYTAAWWLAICLISITTAIAAALAVSLRTANFATYRAFGLTRSGVVAAATLETLFAGIPALLTGAALGLGLAAAAVEQGAVTGMVIPASHLAWVAAGVLAGAVAAAALGSLTVRRAPVPLR